MMISNEFSILNIPRDALNEVVGKLPPEGRVALRFVCKLFAGLTNVRTCKPIKSHIFIHALLQRHLNFVDWLQNTLNCEWHKSWSETAIKTGNLFVTQWAHSQNQLDENATLFAARDGHLNILQWLFSVNFPMNEFTPQAAVGAGNLEMVQWLESRGVIFHRCITQTASTNGNVAVMEFLHQKGYALTPSTSGLTAYCGHLELLKWLHAHDCPINMTACHNAITQGHIHILEWLRMNTEVCPLDNPFICHVALTIGNQQHRNRVLEWALRNGFPWSFGPLDNQVSQYIRRNAPHLLRYIQNP